MADHISSHGLAEQNRTWVSLVLSTGRGYCVRYVRHCNGVSCSCLVVRQKTSQIYFLVNKAKYTAPCMMEDLSDLRLQINQTNNIKQLCQTQSNKFETLAITCHRWNTMSHRHNDSARDKHTVHSTRNPTQCLFHPFRFPLSSKHIICDSNRWKGFPGLGLKQLTQQPTSKTHKDHQKPFKKHQSGRGDELWIVRIDLVVYCCSSSTSLTFQRSAPVKGFVADIRDDGDAFQRLALEIPDSVTNARDWIWDFECKQCVPGGCWVQIFEKHRKSQIQSRAFVHARDWIWDFRCFSKICTQQPIQRPTLLHSMSEHHLASCCPEAKLPCSYSLQLLYSLNRCDIKRKDIPSQGSDFQFGHGYRWIQLSSKIKLLLVLIVVVTGVVVLLLLSPVKVEVLTIGQG